MIFLRRRKPRKRVARQAWPKHLAREYASIIKRGVDLVRELIGPLEDQMKFELGDARQDAPGDIRQIIAQIKAELEARLKPTSMLEIARQLGQRVDGWARTQLGRQIRSAFGADVLATEPDLAQQIEAFAEENVALIRNVPQKLVDDIEQAATRAVASGMLHRDFAVELEEKFGFAERRARLIARDQVGKLYGQINATRQKALGIKRFVWRSVMDRRVRPRHVQLNGQVFRYDKLPDEGLPGTPILCRCYPDPVFEDLLGE